MSNEAIARIDAARTLVAYVLREQEFDPAQHDWTAAEKAQVIEDLLALIPEPPRPHDPSDDWYCGKCHGSAYEHSLESSTCIWEPVAVVRPEPPTDDEREALDSVIRGALAPLHIDYTPWHRIVTVLLDAILASPPWRHRHRGPITDDLVAAAVQTYREQSFSTYVNSIYMRAALEAAEAAR